MKILVADSYEAMSRKTVDIVEDCLGKKPDALISFPGGHTPIRLIEMFVEDVCQKKVDITHARFVQLDDWIGIGPDDYGSCSNFILTNLLRKMPVSFQDVFLFNGKDADIDGQLKGQDDFIRKYGPIDVDILGIGLNGHLGFNENGVDFSLRSHRMPLSDTTKRIQSKYFNGRRVGLTEGITMGIAQIMESKCPIVIANGAHKADIIYQMVTAPVTREVPATVLKNHENSILLLDRDAASRLSETSAYVEYV